MQHGRAILPSVALWTLRTTFTLPSAFAFISFNAPLIEPRLQLIHPFADVGVARDLAPQLIQLALGIDVFLLLTLKMHFKFAESLFDFFDRPGSGS